MNSQLQQTRFAFRVTTEDWHPKPAGDGSLVAAKFAGATSAAAVEIDKEHQAQLQRDPRDTLFQINDVYRHVRNFDNYSKQASPMFSVSASLFATVYTGMLYSWYPDYKGVWIYIIDMDAVKAQRVIDPQEKLEALHTRYKAQPPKVWPLWKATADSPAHVMSLDSLQTAINYADNLKERLVFGYVPRTSFVSLRFKDFLVCIVRAGLLPVQVKNSAKFLKLPSTANKAEQEKAKITMENTAKIREAHWKIVTAAANKRSQHGADSSLNEKILEGAAEIAEICFQKELKIMPPTMTDAARTRRKNGLLQIRRDLEIRLITLFRAQTTAWPNTGSMARADNFMASHVHVSV